MNINYEQEVVAYLNLPSIPKKKWDGKTAFKSGVAIINLVNGGKSYAVASFNPNKDTEPMITKVFGLEPYNGVGDIFVVPNYMDNDVKTFDLPDEQSMRAAQRLADEAAELEKEGVKEENIMPENEYFFDHIHNDEEAQAYIRSYNKQKRISGRVPKNHDNIIMRLAAIHAEVTSQKK